MVTRTTSAKIREIAKKLHLVPFDGGALLLVSQEHAFATSNSPRLGRPSSHPRGLISARKNTPTALQLNEVWATSSLRAIASPVVGLNRPYNAILSESIIVQHLSDKHDGRLAFRCRPVDQAN
ncbi:unnamed protein product [Somion occarium]|uniref:Uncharacterized protein n=1 Tax=Somion occarium TaxID=3059160 RepID=A0ABP1E6V0_9APHY